MNKLSLLFAASILAVSANAQVIENGIITEAPEGEVVYYNRVGTSLAMEDGYVVEIPQEGQIEVVIADDGYVYLKDLVCYYTPGTYVCGTIDGDKITVPMGQKIRHWGGILPFDAELWFCSVSRNIFGSVLARNYVQRQTDVTEVTYLIAGDYLILQDSDAKNAVGVFYNDTNRWVGYADYKDDNTMVELPIKPATPTILTYELDEENGLANMTCDVPTVNVDGEDIDPELLRYKIYISLNEDEISDDYEEFVLEPEAYELAEEMTEIPYTFDNGKITTGGATFQLITPLAGEIYNVGIQSIYYGMRRLAPRFIKGDEYITPVTEPNRSDIHWLQVKDYRRVAVGDVNASRTIASTRYYNVAGIESSKPFDGVNIVVNTYTDGTSKVTKVVK